MSKYQLPRLENEKEFENLVNELCQRKYNLQNFQLYGRKGQKQYGIDGFAVTKEKRLILHQCKNKMISRGDSAIQKELLKDIEEETASMVQEFVLDKKYDIETFIFAHSHKQDTKLQDKAIELSMKYSLDITVWSWDIISNMLEEYSDVVQKYYPHFFREKKDLPQIIKLSDEETFLEDIFISIQQEKPIMLLSMTSTPYHNKIAKYYKEKIHKLAIEKYGKKSVFSIYPPLKKEITEAKYFSKLAKQCSFDEVIEDSFEFIDAIEQRLELQDVFLLISEFENGSDTHRKNLALELRTLFSNSYEHSFYVVILGRKKLAKLKFEENDDGNSPLNYFYDFLLPTPTIDDYKQLENIEEDISNMYNLTGGHPELMSFCLKNSSEDYKELLLNSHYGAKFFQKYSNRKERLLKLFNQKEFGWFHIWSNDPLLHELFWDNLIVESGNRFRWIAPIVVEIGKRYFR